MRSLELFLKALESSLGFKDGYYIPVMSTTDSKFPAIKNLKMEVFISDHYHKERISSENYTFNSKEISREEAIDKITILTMQNVLKRYGI